MNNQEIFEKAHEMGIMAIEKCNPTPMVVCEEKNGKSRPIEIVSGGVCGFANIIVTNGRSSFARYIRKEKNAQKAYNRRGVLLYSRGGGQSLERQKAYASGFCKVLMSQGIDCYVESRMD